MPEPRSPEDDLAEASGTKWAAFAGVAVVACCVGHTLLLAVGLGAVGTAVGGALGQPWVVIPATAALVGATALVVIRRRRASCSTTRRNGPPAAIDTTHQGDAHV